MLTLSPAHPHVQAMDAGGLRSQMTGRVETVRVHASTELAAVRDADLVQLSVKSNDTEPVVRRRVVREVVAVAQAGAVARRCRNCSS